MTTEVENTEQSEPVELNNEKTEAKNTPEATAASGEVDKEKQAEERKFTQSELNEVIQKRLVKEQRRMEREIMSKLEEQKTKIEPKREAFQDDEAFMQARIEHLADQRAREKLAEREAKERQETAMESFQEKAEKASERYPDFNVIVGNPSLAINESMTEFIADSEHGADIAYHLGKHPSEAAKIASMTPIKAARELARIEADIAAKPKANPSKAPEPITPVGSRGKSTASTLPSDDDDIDTWMRKERERMRKQR